MLAVALSLTGGMLAAPADTLPASDEATFAVGYARGCPATATGPYRLCLPRQRISTELVKTMSQRLNGASNRAALCAIDAVVVSSDPDCLVDADGAGSPDSTSGPVYQPSTRNLDSDLLFAEIMTDLARAWGRSGNEERARELFARADHIAGLHVGLVPLVRDGVLKEWLTFETDRGQTEQALHVAKTLTASHRRMLDLSPWWPATDLANALKTEADLLDRLGRRDEAEERRAEADSLMAGP